MENIEEVTLCAEMYIYIYICVCVCVCVCVYNLVKKDRDKSDY